MYNTKIKFYYVSYENAKLFMYLSSMLQIMIGTVTNFKWEDVDMIGEFLDNEARETSILLKYRSFMVTVLSTFRR